MHKQTMSEAVSEFNELIGHRRPEVPQLNPSGVAFQLKGCREEMDEIADALASNNLPEQVDGFIDLIYFALGGLHKLGAPTEECFAAVHAANMQKKRAKIAAESKRGSAEDAVKPEGWVPPDIASILRVHGWNG